MKKTIHFSKGFLASVIISSLIIISGIVAVIVRGGLNLGLDFKPEGSGGHRGMWSVGLFDQI